MTLLELAERCEKATGPDRELDRDIHDALGLTPNRHGFESFAFTASLDAAMTLVPEDCLAMVKQLWDGKQKTALGRVSRYGKTMWTGDWSGLSSEPALALCAAALRARQARGETL